MRCTRPFFIVGTPRSGTTLLQAMFMAADGLYVPPETHFMALTMQREKINGHPSTDSGLANNIEQILGVCDRHELPVDKASLEKQLRQCERSYAGLFDALLWHMQQRRPGCRRIGEKSPGHLRCVPQLLDMFDDARIITIIRDARDVALSHETAFGSTALRAAIAWRRDQRLHAHYRKTLPADRYTSVRYEDLVGHPAQELARLCAFLGEPYCASMLAYHQRREAGFPQWESYKAMTMQPLTTSRVGRYRTQLSRPKIALVQAIAGAELRANGHTLEAAPRLAALAVAARQLPGLLATRFRWHRDVRRLPGEGAPSGRPKKGSDPFSKKGV